MVAAGGSSVPKLPQHHVDSITEGKVMVISSPEGLHLHTLLSLLSLLFFSSLLFSSLFCHGTRPKEEINKILDTMSG